VTDLLPVGMEILAGPVADCDGNPIYATVTNRENL